MDRGGDGHGKNADQSGECIKYDYDNNNNDIMHRSNILRILQ